MGQLPLLLGALTGCVVAGIAFAFGWADLFGAMPSAALEASAWKLGDGSIFAVPAFSLPKVSWTAAAAIMPIAIATIPESTAHMYQLDIYVNDVARKKEMCIRDSSSSFPSPHAALTYKKTHLHRVC